MHEKTLVDEDFVQNLIRQQKADGCFKFGNIFQDILKLNQEEIKQKCPTNIKFDDWLTAIAIFLLTKKFADEKVLWELIVDKAKKYLKKNGHDINNLLDMASNSF